MITETIYLSVLAITLILFFFTLKFKNRALCAFVAVLFVFCAYLVYVGVSQEIGEIKSLNTTTSAATVLGITTSTVTGNEINTTQYTTYANKTNAIIYILLALYSILELVSTRGNKDDEEENN